MESALVDDKAIDEEATTDPHAASASLHRLGGEGMAEIELAELIENLRSELSKARQAAKNQELRFEVGQVELEMSVAVSREGRGSGGIKFWVIELGGEAKAGSAATQKMKLTLSPVLASGGKALVTGQAETGER